MYQTILLAAALAQWERYSAHALAGRDVAAELARYTSKHVRVLSVYEYAGLPNTFATEMGAKYCQGELEERAARARQETDRLMIEKMDDYVRPLETEGLTVSRILRVGNPRTAIVEVARSAEADVLVIGSHSKRGPFDIAMGGTAQQVVRHAPCMVLLVSPRPQRPGA